MKQEPCHQPPAKASPDRDLAGALHEVSNALTVVLGWLDNARDRLEQNGFSHSEAALEAVEVARSHASLGHGIARRAVGAPVSDATELRSVLALVRETVRGISPVAERRHVEICVDDNAADVLLPDAGTVQQILINLLLNAVSFTPRGERVHLILRSEGNRFLFRVRDRGPGVPADQRDSLFSVGPSRRPGGAGIGLAYSHSLAESRGGTLALIDGNSGACFELLWPVSDAPSTTLPRSSSAPKMLDGLRVAVLEDDAAVMSLLEFGLGSRGVELIAMSRVEQLEQLIAEGQHVDAALLDLSPIAKDPRGIIAALHRSSPGVCVFLISGTAISQNLGSDITGWIRKPFELGEIFQALAKAQSGG